MESPSFLVRWSNFFLTRYRVTILLIVAILFGGLWGLSNNQRQDFPQIPTNYIFVQAVYPGASSADVERQVVIPIEQVVEQVDGVGTVRSSAANNFSFVTIEMESIAKTKEATATINEELNSLSLPENVEVNTEMLDVTGPAIAYGIVGGNGETSNDLLSLVDAVQPRLQNASNEIDRIDIVPENEYEVQIILDGAAIGSSGLSAEQIKQTIQAFITSLPGGRVETEEGRKQAINIVAPVTSLDALKAISLGRVTLDDVAEIVRQPKDNESIHFGGFKKDGEAFAHEAVYLLVYKKADGDIIRIKDATTEAITQIKDDKILPEGVDIVTLYDTAPFIEDQISSLLNNGYLGLVLILLVLLFFINLRTAFVVALIIPLAFLTTFFILNLIGFSFNILTLFALILTLGILVDNAIVIAEGIVHEIDHGASKRDAALTAVHKFGPAVTAATITTVIVFIPFAMLGGIVGAFLKFIPFTIIITLLVSYLLAISVTPVLGRIFLKQETKEEKQKRSLKSWEKATVLPAVVFYGQRFLDWIRAKYANLMHDILPSKWKKALTIIVTTVLLMTSFGVFAPMLKFEQFPTNDGNVILTEFSFPTGTSFAEQKDIIVRAQDIAIDLPYFETFYSFGNVLYMTFTEPVDRTDGMTISEIVDVYNERLDAVRAEINPEIEIDANDASYGPPEPAFDLVVEFLSNDSVTLSNAAQDLVKFVNEREHIAEVENSLEELSQPSVRVALDQSRLQTRGVNPLAAAGTVNAVFAEQQIGSFVVRDDGVSDDLYLSFAEGSTDSIDDLRNLALPTQAGQLVRLQDVASIEEVNAPVEISRVNGERVATINVALTEDAPDTAQAELDQAVRDYLSAEKLEDLGLNSNGVVYGGALAAFQEDYSSLQIVFVLAMIFVYLVLVNQFNSFMQPALILFTVPLALIGVFPGLLAVNSSLNMISGLGVIALVGVVVNDAIVFIDAMNRYRKFMPEATWNEVLVQTGHSRFKPIFSTSITTIGGILPLTIIDPFWQGLGTAIIAGLIFSTIGTLIVVPVLYRVFKREKKADPAAALPQS